MKKIFTFMLSAFMAVTVSAQFSGSGSGTQADPYLIFNPIQLDQMRNFLGQENVYFKLMADIDLSEFIADNYPTQGWQPIGTTSSPFQGNFNGNGKRIYNLSINRPSTNYVGLIGCVGANASFSNFTVEGNIIGNNYTGGVVGNGYKISFSMNGVNFKGNIQGVNYVGGLIGYTSSNVDIKNCQVEAHIKGTDYIGGVAGYTTNASISSSSAMIDILSQGKYCGGIVGHVGSGKPGTSINTCSVYGDIVGSDYLGGIVGSLNCDYNDSSKGLSNVYFIGNIIGNDYIGGICGENKSGFITKSYVRASISGVNLIGGVVGMAYSGSTISQNVTINSSINGMEKVGRVYGKAVGGSIGAIGTATTNKSLNTTKIFINGIEQTCEDNPQHGQGVGNSVLKYMATYQGIEWDFANTWDIQETESYPYFKTQVAPPIINNAMAGETIVSGKGTNGAKIIVKTNGKTYQTTCNSNTWSVTVDALIAGSKIDAYATASGKSPSYPASTIVAYKGQGTEENPYEIYTAAELANVNGDGFYKIMNDIDISSYNPWSPIGLNSPITIQQIDGDNHTISGLKINSKDKPQGLFGQCTGTTIKNIKLTVSSFSGGNYSGALVGKILNGKIKNCQVIGNVTGQNYTGGIVGYSKKTYIAQCTVKGNVTGTTTVGGVAGYVENSTFEKTQYKGNASSSTASAIVGGLIGATSGVTVKVCFSSGKATCSKASSIVGGLIGKSSSVVTNCYSTSAVTAGQDAGGLIGRNFRTVQYCYALGNVTSTNVAAGLVGYNDGSSATVSNCYAMNTTIKASSSGGTAIRIIGGIANSAPTPEMDNYALKTMAVSINGVPQTIYDDNLNGTAKTEEQLMQEETYADNSWDMETIWGIEEGASYPYLRYFTKFATITFCNYDGTELQTKDVRYDVVPTYNGTTPTKPSTAKYTYTFKGWKPELAAVTGEATYVADFDSIINKYLIVFKNEDGTELQSSEVEYGTLPIAPSNPTQASTVQFDYVFDKWTPNIVEVTGDATYTATYISSLREYTITFLNDDGSVISSKEYKYGETPIVPTNPTKANTAEFTYTFAGWTPTIVAVTGDATYKATFDATKNSYTITWQNDDGSVIDKTTVEYGVAPTHADPTKANTAEFTYTFAGWTPTVVAVTGDATYKATFNATKNSYTITWQNEDGSLIDKTTVVYGVVPTHADPTKASTAEFTYAFAGWTPTIVAVTGDATYKATFNATKNSYTITWQNDDGSVINKTIVEYGVVPTHADPTKVNTAEFTYTFAGWTPAVAAVSGDATYKATFNSELNTYTITFIVKDNPSQSFTMKDVPYGTSLQSILEQVIEVFGGTTFEDDNYIYTFVGLEDVDLSELVTGDATYYVLYTIKEKDPTALDEIDMAEPVTKFVRDGQIFIQRGDKLYTLQGQEAK